MRPLVTILVPSIGRVEYLRFTRDSISAQTFRDFEVLILDNACGAEAEALFSSWARSDPRVRVLRVEPRIPMFPNFNRGIRAAQGKYITFCHDDDVLRPEFIERQTNMMERHPNVGLSGANYDFIDVGGAVTDRIRFIKRTETWSGQKYIRTLIRRGRNPITMQSAFFRAEAFKDGLDESLSLHFGDYVNLMRIAEKGDVGLIADPLVCVRRHEGQASNAIPLSEAIPMRTRMMDDYCREYEARHPGEEAFVRELRRSVAISHRVGMAWGWMSARHTDEAIACASGMGRTPIDRGVGTILENVERLGIRKTASLGWMAKAIRRAANELGM